MLVQSARLDSLQGHDFRRRRQWGGLHALVRGSCDDGLGRDVAGSEQHRHPQCGERKRGGVEMHDAVSQAPKTSVGQPHRTPSSVLVNRGLKQALSSTHLHAGSLRDVPGRTAGETLKTPQLLRLEVQPRPPFFGGVRRLEQLPVHVTAGAGQGHQDHRHQSRWAAIFADRALTRRLMTIRPTNAYPKTTSMELPRSSA